MDICIDNRGRSRTGSFGSALAGWAGLIALVGCGSVSGIPIDETATRIADTVCPKAYMCCTADQLSGNSSAGTDVASCEAATAMNYRNILSTLQASVDAGRATYQSAQVDNCLNTIMNSDCATLDMTNHLAGIPGCASFTTPLVAIGGTCTQNYECIDGWCSVPMNASSGTCTAFVPYGQSCTAAGGPSCGPNAVCDIEGTLNDSSDDLCEPVSGDGGPCTDNLQCTSLNCSSSGGSGMTCQEPATPPPAMCFYASGCSAGGRPGPGTLLLFAAFAAVAFARSARARGRR
jgi:hypothetical protein